MTAASLLASEGDGVRSAFGTKNHFGIWARGDLRIIQQSGQPVATGAKVGSAVPLVIISIKFVKPFQVPSVSPLFKGLSTVQRRY